MKERRKKKGGKKKEMAKEKERSIDNSSLSKKA